MKMYPIGLVVIALSAVLAGCGSQADCNSGDVHETYLEMAGNLKDQEAMEILQSSVFESVVTKDKDKDTGYRSCAATIVMQNEAGKRERNVSYQIEQVQSGDASFTVYADRNDLGQISYMATELANKNRANKKTKELVDEAAKNPFVLASDQDAREAGINIGGRFFGDRVDASSVTSTSLDIDGDGVMEFVTAMRVNYSSGDSNWYVFASYQYPKGPGEKNSVEFAGEGAIEEISVEPSSYEMQGKNLVATMADGSKKSLVHHTSTEAYQAYIKANGGNPAASITPSAMSVSASLGAAQVVAPATGAARGAGVIDAAIAAQAKQDGGSEHTQARKLAKGDIDGDGIPDLAVLFTLQGVGGEDRSVSYLAGFVAKAGQLKLVDTVSVGNAKGMHLEKDGAVRLTLLMPGPDNAQVAVEDNYMLNENTWMLVQAHP